MKLNLKTTTPTKLKSEILKIIEDKTLETWSVHVAKDVKYIKHVKQWGEKGVIKMMVDLPNSQLTVQVLPFEKTTQNVKDFEGYYLGRFCELIFVNFPDLFTSIQKS